jgi:NAD(P)-dependent dehydrogenase (short-subunit alcohol dehydrogenase family)
VNVLFEDLFGLGGRVSLVTGAGRGIGRAAALGLAGAGSDVAIVSRSEDELRTVAREIEAQGVRSLPIVADVTALEKAQNVVDQVVDAFGRLDVLVNNAGGGLRTPFTEISADELDRLVALNMTSAFVLSQAAVRQMRIQGSGKIVNVTSVAADRANPGSAVYSMAKAGLRQLTRALAGELALEGLDVQVNCLGPGVVATEQLRRMVEREPPLLDVLTSKVPQRRMGEPGELVAALLFLTGPGSGYVTGQTIYVDGGWTACM